MSHVAGHHVTCLGGQLFSLNLILTLIVTKLSNVELNCWSVAVLMTKLLVFFQLLTSDAQHPPLDHTFTAMSSKFEVNWLRLLWNFWSCHWYHWWFCWIFWEAGNWKGASEATWPVGKGPYVWVLWCPMFSRHAREKSAERSKVVKHLKVTIAERRDPKPWWKAAKMPRTDAGNESPCLWSPNKPLPSYSNHHYSERMANLKLGVVHPQEKIWRSAEKYTFEVAFSTHHSPGPQLGVFPLLCEPVPKPDVGWRQEFQMKHIGGAVDADLEVRWFRLWFASDGNNRMGLKPWELTSDMGEFTCQGSFPILGVLEWNGDTLHLISCVQVFQKVLHATKWEDAPKITFFLDCSTSAQASPGHHHHHLDVFLDQKAQTPQNVYVTSLFDQKPFTPKPLTPKNFLHQTQFTQLLHQR